MDQAYQIYQKLSDGQRKVFWNIAANVSKIQRDRIYKFFRFTYNPYRDEIRFKITQYLVENKITQKSHQLSQQLWKLIWSQYQDKNLHYDATDQFVRNCTTNYFNKVSKGEFEQMQQNFTQKKQKQIIQNQNQQCSVVETPSTKDKIMIPVKHMLQEDQLINQMQCDCQCLYQLDLFSEQEQYEVDSFLTIEPDQYQIVENGDILLLSQKDNTEFEQLCFGSILESNELSFSD